MTPKPTYLLTLQAQPDRTDPHGHRRLRMAMKTLGRAFGLRTIHVREVKGDPPKETK